MPTPPNLTKEQKERLSRLEPQLKQAVKQKDFKTAKNVVFDIQSLLRPTRHFNRIVQAKNRLFELAMDVGEYNIAEQGLIGNRKLVNINTRLYLEATALLAIYYLRTSNYEKAKPLIQEVLQNEKVITSENTRREFRRTIINRFNEEVALYSLKVDKGEILNVDEIQEKAGTLIATNTEDNLYLLLGESLPQQTKDILFHINTFSQKQLPSAERKMLPSPQDAIKDEAAGKTVFNSLKRVIYDSLCDSKSEVYKAWYTNGMAVVLDKKYITSSVVMCLSGLGIGFNFLAISAVALVIRLGLDVYCEHNKPGGIMEIRVR